MKTNSLGRALDGLIKSPNHMQQVQSTVSEFSEACSDQRVCKLAAQDTGSGYVLNYQVHRQSKQYLVVNSDGQPWSNSNDLIQFLKTQHLQLRQITLTLNF